jgi:hypothetical protein
MNWGCTGFDGTPDHEDARRATLVELVNTTGEKTTGDNFGYRMAA